MSGLGKWVAGAWVTAQNEGAGAGAVCGPNESQQKHEPRAWNCNIRLTLYLLPLPGLHSFQPFLLVRLSEHCPKRNYIVFGDEITSEQAVFFTLGHSAASPFYLFFDFTLYLL